MGTCIVGHVFNYNWLDRRQPGSCPAGRAVSHDANVIPFRLNGSIESTDECLPHHVPQAEHPHIQAPDTHEGIPATLIDILQDEDGLQIWSPSLENYFDEEDMNFDDEDICLHAKAPEDDEEDPDLNELAWALVGVVS